MANKDTITSSLFPQIPHRIYFLQEEILIVQVNKKEYYCITENVRKFYTLKIRGDLIKGKKSNQRKLKLKTSKAEVTVEAQRKQSSWPINNKGRNIFSQM